MAMIFHNSHVWCIFDSLLVSSNRIVSHRIAWVTHTEKITNSKLFKGLENIFTSLISLFRHLSISFCIWCFFPFSVIVIFTCMCKVWLKVCQTCKCQNERERLHEYIYHLYMTDWEEMLLFFMCWTCFIAKMKNSLSTFQFPHTKKKHRESIFYVRMLNFMLPY